MPKEAQTDNKDISNNYMHQEWNLKWLNTASSEIDSMLLFILTL